MNSIKVGKLYIPFDFVSRVYPGFDWIKTGRSNLTVLRSYLQFIGHPDLKLISNSTRATFFPARDRQCYYVKYVIIIRELLFHNFKWERYWEPDWKKDRDILFQTFVKEEKNVGQTRYSRSTRNIRENRRLSRSEKCEKIGGKVGDGWVSIH